MLNRAFCIMLFLVAAAMLTAAEGTSESATTSAPAQPRPTDITTKLAETLPKWLTLGVEVRGRSDNYYGYMGNPGNDNSWYLHRFRINASLTMTPWLKFVGQVQDSRVFDYDIKPVPYTVQNPWDLRQAYFIVGDESHNWSLRAGRQPLIFGDMRLVSTSNWGNVGANYDAFRISRKWKSVRMDAFTGLVVVPSMGFDRPRMDKKLTGIYTSIDLPKKRILDVYSFWKQNLRVTDERANPGLANIFTYGVRSAGNWTLGFDYNVEMAIQRGHIVKDSFAAWAGHWEIGHRIIKANGPRLWAEYNYSTGDNGARDGRKGTFDQMYPTNVYGTATDFGWRNLHEPAGGVEWNFAKSWKLKNTYHMFWLANRHDGIYTLTGALYASNPNATSSRVGSELDTRIIFQPNKHYQIWIGYGHLFAGPFLQQTSKSSSVDYPYIMWTYIL